LAHKMNSKFFIIVYITFIYYYFVDFIRDDHQTSFLMLRNWTILQLKISKLTNNPDRLETHSPLYSSLIDVTLGTRFKNQSRDSFFIELLDKCQI
jgi:hypothetical protein